jgi:hypothetical protein
MDLGLLSCAMGLPWMVCYGLRGCLHLCCANVGYRVWSLLGDSSLCAGKQKAREEQHGARKKAKRANGNQAPIGEHTPPGMGVGGGGGAGGAVAAKAESNRQTPAQTVTWALRGFRSVREHCVAAS